MNSPGADSHSLLVRARSVLLDAIDALAGQKSSVVLIGAQAVYLHTGSLNIALAEATKDADLALDPRLLVDDPLIEAAMAAAGFYQDVGGQPGAWLSVDGIPVDLMVPESLAGAGDKQARAARIPPHARNAIRRARGLEAAVVDCADMAVHALDPSDSRVRTIKVAGPAALLIAKTHKIAERVGAPTRLNDKDAHDIYRLLRSQETSLLARKLRALRENDISRECTEYAIAQIKVLFAPGPDAIGSAMAGRAEEAVGDPDVVSTATALLAADLLTALDGDDN
jgi:hypothetical protein